MRSLLWTSVLIAAGARLAVAAPASITLPPETASLKKSSLPGYVIAVQKCAVCHSVDYIHFQPPAMTLGQWTAEAAKMQHLYGAPISDDEVKQVGAYLAVAYGGTKEQELAANLRTATALPVRQAVDLQALLAANACLACHAVNKKVVGPAYREVAGKYQKTAGALSKVEASIRAGGSGKWGPASMPPFPQLKPDELRALAEFVLKQ